MYDQYIQQFEVLSVLQETFGVPVVSYSDTDEFPAFYSRKSGFKVSRKHNLQMNLINMISESLAGK